MDGVHPCPHLDGLYRAATVDQAVWCDSCLSGSSCHGVGVPHGEVRAADEYRVEALGGLPGCQNSAILVGDGHGTAGALAVHRYQDGTLGGSVTKVLGHARHAQPHNGAACDGGGAVAIQSGVSALLRPGYQYGPATHGEGSVGVQPISSGVNGELAAGDVDEDIGLVLSGSPGSVDAVVTDH